MTSTQPGTVLVTGASSGFGEAITRRFAAAGARVVATARRSDRLKDLAADLYQHVRTRPAPYIRRATIVAGAAATDRRARRDPPR